MKNKRYCILYCVFNISMKDNANSLKHDNDLSKKVDRNTSFYLIKAEQIKILSKSFNI